MTYGWKQIGNKRVDSTVGVSGYEALKIMCYVFYDYTTNNKGVFTAILWYNKYESVDLSLEIMMDGIKSLEGVK